MCGRKSANIMQSSVDRPAVMPETPGLFRFICHFSCSLVVVVVGGGENLFPCHCSYFRVVPGFLCESAQRCGNCGNLHQPGGTAGRSVRCLEARKPNNMDKTCEDYRIFKL